MRARLARVDSIAVGKTQEISSLLSCWVVSSLVSKAFWNLKHPWTSNVLNKRGRTRKKVEIEAEIEAVASINPERKLNQQTTG